MDKLSLIIEKPISIQIQSIQASDPVDECNYQKTEDLSCSRESLVMLKSQEYQLN